MSCSSATLSTLWPGGRGHRLRSASTPRPIAVDDSARPERGDQREPPGDAERRARRAPSISSAEPNSCTLPQPKIGRRSAHRRRGSSSRPTRNSISTTPNSAKCSMSCGSRDELQAPRPDDDAGGEVADDRAEAERARERHRDHRGGQVDEARPVSQCGMCRRSHLGAFRRTAPVGGARAAGVRRPRHVARDAGLEVARSPASRGSRRAARA